MLHILRTVPLCPPNALRVASEEHRLSGLVHVVHVQKCTFVSARRSSLGTCCTRSELYLCVCQTFFARYMLYMFRNVPLCPPDVLRKVHIVHVQNCTFVSTRRSSLGTCCTTCSELYICVRQTFFAWPVKNTISLGFSSLQFPAITVCNVNPVRISMLPNMSADFQDLVSSVQPDRLGRVLDAVSRL